ncbi:MAG TPA: polymer-forming cytoskeletal protein [Chthoniobacterales bacterium]|jgi:cytoskeletal protein CcmA (bactofilin family)|nr:polymer-forming cytoskeletal protein [Chthoniobacterales bacterium]
MEYAAAKSTMCRQCGSHFAPAAPKQEMIRLRPREEHVEAAAPANDAGLLQKIEGFWTKHHSSEIECFDCKAKHEVSSAATSSFCPKCSTHVDLRNYKITTSFSRSIKTQGEIHVTPKGDLSSTTVTCRSALIEGKMRGNMNCVGTATINFVGKIPGRLIADNIVIDRKSDVHFFRRIRVKTIEIRGRMTGEIVAEGAVVIHRNALLDGNVTAKSISVEKGGIFMGQLIIGTSGLAQAELLPEQPAASTPAATAEEAAPLAVPHALPAA